MGIKVTRRSFLGAAGGAAGALALAGCGGSSGTDSGTEAADGPLTGTYEIHVQGYDWGAGVDKVTLSLSAPVEAVSADDFTVSEHKQATDWTAEGFPVIEADFDRQVTAAYLVDADGNETTDASDKVALELYCSPNDGSPFLYSMATGFNTWCDPYELNIATAEGSALGEITIDPACAGKTTSADAWALGSFDASDGTTFPYAAFDPEEDSKTLVIWLHGAGEGGTENTDPYVTILANKVVALSEDEFQTTVGGAHVVAPQSPTMWMDQGPDADGNPTYIAEDATEVTSIYTQALEEFIDAYAEQVGAEKVVLAGCSNGGFMTLWMGLDRPERYAAIVPICEAIPDGAISDEMIEGIKDLPMYFVWSDDDTTVDPATHEIPTVQRLKDAGASELHVSTTEHVIDTSGEFFAMDEEGNVTDEPYEYAGHWSWIYFDNNECECDDDGLKAFDFIAEHVK